MKKIWTVLSLISTLFLVLSLAYPCFAQDKASKEECVAKVREAVKLIKEIGTDAAFKKIMDKSGPFIWKDSYVFCVDDEMAKMLAHPVPRALGFPFMKWKDADGKEPFVEILDIAKSKGEGWKSYNHLKPGAPKPLMKNTYFMMEPGSGIIVGAGYYDYK